MDAIAQQIGQRMIDEAVPLDAILSRKCGGNDLDGEMAFAARIMTAMAAMLDAVVDHGEPLGRQSGLQQMFDLDGDRAGGSLCHHSYIAWFYGESCVADAGPRQPRFHGRVPGDRRCSIPGCDERGEFRAPPEQGPRADFNGPGEWRFLCLDHVRAFNARYNFFTGMTAEEIGAQQRPYAGWERETRAFNVGAGGTPRWSDFLDPLDAIQARYGSGRNAARKDGRPLSDNERRALRVLGLEADVDRRALRQRYSELVRRYHPDRNGGDRGHEKALQDVIEAYTLLKKAEAFA